MISIFTLILFIFGLIIGSFLNVVIFRLNTQKSLWRALGGRSGCMTCQNKLSWYELFPVFSFLGLRGRCKNCQTKISIQYPLVELATGFIFAGLFLKLQVFNFIYLYYAFMFSILLVIAVYDLRHKIIPDKLSLIFGILAFLGLFLFHAFSVFQFLAAFLIAFPFAFFWLISSGRWMGLGDAKLALGIGWFLGFSLAFSALVWAFWIGAVVGISLVLFSKKYKMKSEIPFAPYLVLGAFLVFIFGLNIFIF
jgi:leader peptidase (prepilin peptidase) / N-methyltransferase